MASHLTDKKFVYVWETSNSVTEASVRLLRKGYQRFDPNFTLVTAEVLREFGIPVKKMSRGDLPDFVDEQEKAVADSAGNNPTPPKTIVVPSSPPEVPAERQAARLDARGAAWSFSPNWGTFPFGPGDDYYDWFINERWQFKPGSNG